MVYDIDEDIREVLKIDCYTCKFRDLCKLSQDKRRECKVNRPHRQDELLSGHRWEEIQHMQMRRAR